MCFMSVEGAEVNRIIFSVPLVVEPSGMPSGLLHFFESLVWYILLHFVYLVPSCNQGRVTVGTVPKPVTKPKLC